MKYQDQYKKSQRSGQRIRQIQVSDQQYQSIDDGKQVQDEDGYSELSKNKNKDILIVKVSRHKNENLRYNCILGLNSSKKKSFSWNPNPDTGADVSVISKKTFRKLQLQFA